MNQALERILLHHLEGSRAGQIDSYMQPVVVVGRAPDCHLVLAADKGVSGKHCEIRQSPGQFEVVDTNSTNGTFVGDERVTSRVLKNGDSIRFGWMGPVVRVEFEEAVRAVHPAHPISDAQSTVMVSARRIAAAAEAAPSPPAAPAPAPVAKSPAITMPPPSRAPAPPPVVAPPPAAAAPPPRAAAAPPARAAAAVARPAAPQAAGVWGAGRWILAIVVVVVMSAAAAVGVWAIIR
jgi:predicted component of type VI protein secretion system